MSKMKNTYSVAQRNALVEKYLPRIDTVICRNRRLIRGAKLERDDVYQQLALRLIRAVEDYEPDKGAITDHIDAQLHEEIFDCAGGCRRFGMTDAPADISTRIISLEAYLDAEEYEPALAA